MLRSTLLLSLTLAAEAGKKKVVEVAAPPMTAFGLSMLSCSWLAWVAMTAGLVWVVVNANGWDLPPMKPWTKGTWLITGGSSGIGLELVKQLAARGDTVFVTCRSRASSASGKDAISAIEGDVTVLEGIDVASDGVAAALAKATVLKGVTIDCLVHNAGSINGTRSVAADSVMSEQSLDSITMDRMRAAFEVNTLGPLRVQKALSSQMRSPGGKVAIISTGLGSIGDNSSGGNYAYRTSKAGANMVAKSLSCDLKAKGVAVAAVAPGFVVSEFGPGIAAMTEMGAKPVDQAGKGIIAVVDGLGMSSTGSFLIVPSDGGAPKAMEW